MSRRTYEVKVGGETRMIFSADLTQAAAPIYLVNETVGRVPTPFQTANAIHRERVAAALLNEWCANEGGEAFMADEDFEVVEQAD